MRNVEPARNFIKAILGTVYQLDAEAAFAKVQLASSSCKTAAKMAGLLGMEAVGKQVNGYNQKIENAKEFEERFVALMSGKAESWMPRAGWGNQSLPNDTILIFEEYWVQFADVGFKYTKKDGIRGGTLKEGKLETIMEKFAFRCGFNKDPNLRWDAGKELAAMRRRIPGIHPAVKQEAVAKNLPLNQPIDFTIFCAMMATKFENMGSLDVWKPRQIPGWQAATWEE